MKQMKRIILLISCLMLAGFVSAQEFTETHTNKTDAKGRKQGHWRVFDTNGNIKMEGNYVDGNPQGQFDYFYPDGHKKAVILNYDNGKVAYATLYHPNGNLMAKGKYLNQQKDSLWNYYDQDEGKLVSEEFYKQGKIEGVAKTFYPTGQIAEEQTYKNGLKDGPWAQYFTDGALKGKGEFKDGKPAGMYILYHLNGNVQVSGKYVDGEKDGPWIYLTRIGELEKKEIYDKGNLVSEQTMDVKADPNVKKVEHEEDK